MMFHLKVCKSTPFQFHCVCACVQLLMTPWTAALQAPRCMGFLSQEYWSRSPCPPPGDLPNPGTEPASHASQVDSLPTEPPGKPLLVSPRDFPGSQAAKAPDSQCRGPGFNCWSGN